MTEPSFPLPFEPQDLEPLSIEAVADQLRVSRALVRLCVVSGCPTRADRVSAAELLHWLFYGYEEVRERSGLAPLQPVDGVEEPAQTLLKMANAAITLLEFSLSRSSNPDEKRQLRTVVDFISRALDR